MKVLEIKKEIFFEGKNAGLPCIAVSFFDLKTSMDKTLDEVATEILKFDRTKYIAIYGKLSKDPEIKPLIAGLVSKGKKVIFTTPATEDIGPVRSLPNITFVLTMKPPTKQKNTLRITNLALLKEQDELKILIANMQDYEDAKAFIKSRKLAMPTVLFSVNKIEDTSEIIEQYLKDTDTFNIDNKISKAIFL